MESTHADVDLICVDCGESFVWTASEQAFFARKNLTMPKRCCECRAERRRLREENVNG